jgi:hypothetical protein
VFVSLSFVIINKWRRDEITVKEQANACEIQTCQVFSTWWLSLLLGFTGGGKESACQ